MTQTVIANATDAKARAEIDKSLSDGVVLEYAAEELITGDLEVRMVIRPKEPLPFVDEA